MCWLLCVAQSMYCIHMCLDGWMRWGISQKQLVPFCIYVLAVKLIQITIIVSGCDTPLIFSQLSFIQLSKSVPLWLLFEVGQACLGPSHWVSTPCLRRPRGKSDFNNHVREHSPCQNGSRHVHCWAGNPTPREGGMGLESKQKYFFFPDLLLQRDSM